MKKSLLISVGLIALMAGVIMLPWQAYYVIGVLALVGVLTLHYPPSRRGLRSPHRGTD